MDRRASRSSRSLATGGMFFLVFELVRRRRLMERYALLWLFSTAVLLGLAVWKNLLERRRPHGRHLLRAVGAVRRRVRLRPGAAAALLAGHLAPGRPEQGARAAARACSSSASACSRPGRRRDATPSAPSATRGDLTRRRADDDATRAASRSSWSATTAPPDRARDARGAARPSSAPTTSWSSSTTPPRDGTRGRGARRGARRARDRGRRQPRLRRRLPRRRARPRGRRCCSSSTPTPCRRRAASTRCARAPASSPAWGAWQALVTLADGEHVNTAGNLVHWLGFGWAGGPRRAASRARTARPREVGFASGAAMVVRREAWDATGGFDERYFMYGEDLDLVAAAAAGGLGHRRRAGGARRPRLRVRQGRLQVVLPRAQPLVDAARRLPAAPARAACCRRCWPSSSPCCRSRVARRLAAGQAARAGRRSCARCPPILRRRRAVQATRADRRRAPSPTQLTASLDSPYLAGAASRAAARRAPAAYWRAVRACWRSG